MLGDEKNERFKNNNYLWPKIVYKNEVDHFTSM